MSERAKESVLFCKPDWSIVCSPDGCFCEYRPPTLPAPPQVACVPPAQIQCAGTMCMCTSVHVPTPILTEPAPAADCGVIAALAAASIYKALLACR